MKRLHRCSSVVRDYYCLEDERIFFLQKSRSVTQSEHLDDSTIHVKKVHRRSSVKSIPKNQSVDVRRLSRLSQKVGKTAKRVSIQKETNPLDDTQTKSTVSVVHVRRIKRARDSGDSTNDQFINKSTNNENRTSSLSNQNKSINTTVNRTSFNTSVKVRRKFFLLDHLFLSIE